MDSCFYLSVSSYGGLRTVLPVSCFVPCKGFFGSFGERGVGSILRIPRDWVFYYRKN